MTKPKQTKLLSGGQQFNKLIGIVIVAALVPTLYFGLSIHAAAGGGPVYHSIIATPKNVVVKANTCGSNAFPGIIVEWDRPADYALISNYLLYKNGAFGGSFGTSGARTPQRTGTCFFGTFKTGDKITVQATASSDNSAPAMVP